MNLTLLIFFCTRINMASGLRKKANLYFLTNIDLFLLVKEAITDGIYHAIHRYAKANNKYTKYYDKNKESSS